MRVIAAFALPLAAQAAGGTTYVSSQCSDFKNVYTSEGCCGNPDYVTNYQVVPVTDNKFSFGTNPCEGAKPDEVAYFDNIACGAFDGVVGALEQSGTNVTLGYQGEINTTGRGPIGTSYFEAGLCPVNVHWHLGTEHYSVGQYDEFGTGPPDGTYRRQRRLSASSVRRGFRCQHYDDTDPKYTTEYNWQHCVDMKVGETYEVHWPHSKAGACGTPWQYQYPFYDGVFCRPNIVTLDPLTTYSAVGVQAQIFTIVNDEHYYYPDLMRGWIKEGVMGMNITYYTGSTTGTTRDNQICSRYTPITWQVDRMCHLISASSFDKMCADMKTQADDMSGDLHAHGSRELVLDMYAADNHHTRRMQEQKQRKKDL